MTWNRRSVLRGTGIVAGAGVVGVTSVSAGVASAADGTDDEGVLEGTVTHFGVPIPDATVRAVGESGAELETETDGRGAYDLALGPGAHVVEARADGYEAERAVASVDAGETAALGFDLERSWGPDEGDLEVYATGVGGGATIPCDVTIYGDETYHTPAPHGSVPDDENWTRGFVVSEGWWEVLVTDAAGYTDGYEEVYVEAGETAVAAVELREGDAEIPTEGTLEGTVTDADGEPITSAWLRVGARLTSVDDDGHFALALENGYYDVSVNAGGYESLEDTVRVRFGTTTTLSVTLEAVEA